ncbi:MAG TPA: MmcQ/YjbR family DNA-binding protein [Kineosporiaceae bacterium]|nr:MmcQ/YjbR family DNA-binding protein [Kineosporiaceae bacterium]
MGGGDGLARRVIERCEQLPGAELTFPFGPQPAVYKIGGKMFAVCAGPSEQALPTQLSLKCDPEYASALRREHAAIRPGYHLNKRHWITVDLAGELPDGLVEDLVEDSYDLVYGSLPRARRARLSAEPTIAAATGRTAAGQTRPAGS